MATTYIPIRQPVFTTEALIAGELARGLALPSTAFLAVEMEKGLARQGL